LLRYHCVGCKQVQAIQCLFIIVVYLFVTNLMWSTNAFMYYKLLSQGWKYIGYVVSGVRKWLSIYTSAHCIS